MSKSNLWSGDLLLQTMYVLLVTYGIWWTLFIQSQDCSHIVIRTHLMYLKACSSMINYQGKNTVTLQRKQREVVNNNRISLWNQFLSVLKE